MLVLIHRSRSAGKKAGNWANKRKVNFRYQWEAFLVMSCKKTKRNFCCEYYKQKSNELPVHFMICGLLWSFENPVIVLAKMTMQFLEIHVFFVVINQDTHMFVWFPLQIPSLTVSTKCANLAAFMVHARLHIFPRSQSNLFNYNHSSYFSIFV